MPSPAADSLGGVRGLGCAGGCSGGTRRAAEEEDDDEATAILGGGVRARGGLADGNAGASSTVIRGLVSGSRGGGGSGGRTCFEVELLGKLLSSTVVASELLETVVATSEVRTAAVVECTANGGSGG